MAEWISVKDRLPEKYEEGGFRGGLMDVYTYIGDNDWEDDYGYYNKAEEEGITHWMPLPSPPNAEE